MFLWISEEGHLCMWNILHARVPALRVRWCQSDGSWRKSSGEEFKWGCCECRKEESAHSAESRAPVDRGGLGVWKRAQWTFADRSLFWKERIFLCTCGRNVDLWCWLQIMREALTMKFAWKTKMVKIQAQTRSVCCLWSEWGGLEWKRGWVFVGLGK